MTPARLVSILWGLGFLSCLFAFQIAFAQTVDFQRDVQPILAEHCARCHGVDAATRQSGLRLDDRQAALKGGESGSPAIVPGKPDESELIRRVASHDPDSVMPPKKENKPLIASQIATLRKWITEGANYSVHWSFVAPQKAPLPDVGTRQPIDAFVASHLKSNGLKHSEPTTSSNLCRRLYLDLIGLVPSPQEIEAFEKNGLESTVDMLLKSDRYGEKWARHWLDVARYSDTNGYEKDVQRDQWIWRDWVIDSLNRDLPYDQFIVEQIAGDLIPNRTQDQLIATGFLRNSMLNEEGAIIAEEFRMAEMFDRIDCLGKAVFGLSTQCAQCHSHKFDPISQDEYYGMFAFLNNTYEAQSWIYTLEQQQQIDKVVKSIREIDDRARLQIANWQQELSAWETDVLKQQVDWVPMEAIEMGSISGLNHPTQLFDKSLLMRGHISADVFMIAQPELKGVTGLRIEALTHGDLPFGGPGRGPNGIWGITEIEVFVQKPESKDWEKLKLTNATADFSEPEQKEEKKTRGPVSFLIDGSDDTSWETDRGIGRRNQPSVAVVQFEQPLDLPTGTKLKYAMRTNDMLVRCRVSTTVSPAPKALPIDYAAVMAMQVPPAERSADQHSTIFAAWRQTVADLKSLNDEAEAIWKQYPTALTSVLHASERRGEYVRPTHFLDRGGWDRPLKEVKPHTPVAFHPMGSDASPNRLTFARWLADRKSPLTARVAVNRVWQAMFGMGLVETAEDFGTRAPVPEYRDLLDWLAVDFMDNGWSQKKLIRTIVTSVTYQQSSKITPELFNRDPRNQLLARGPRFRAEAEVVRDIALSASGLITHKLGGPGIIPPVPQNVLDYNFVYPAYWKPTQGPDRYRRTVYAFRKRSMPDPALSTFDAPNSDFACARRVRSNTPLAALTSLNETIFVESAQAMALRVLKEGGSTDASRSEYAFRLCTGRRPTKAESDEILALLKSRRQRLAEGWLSIREVATGDATKLPELPPQTTPQDAAAWSLVSRALLNLDETLCKN
ncbi:MAG: DUF1553 domain-containing protein [Planctomycetes bacterium]|nr:DUF1553 domain-containing protein [Planctomycetota bacterium]